jgi:hypothetical protein
MCLFGTSGIRRIVGKELFQLAFKVGLAVGGIYHSVVVGSDTRTSSSALKHTLISGVLAGGGGCFDVGVLPTPTLALAARGFRAGVMITASHNPPQYNGIKLLNPDGSAFDAAQCAQIEELVLGDLAAAAPWNSIKESGLLSGALEEHIKRIQRDFPEGLRLKAVAAALAELKGSYAVVVLAAGESKLVVARKGSPLIIGVGDREHFIASDVPAVLDYTNRVIYLEDGDLAVVTAGGVGVTSRGARVEREEARISWSVEDAQKAGYAHFMLKEVHEQPKVIRDTLVNWVSVADSVVDIAAMRRNLESMLILACGTSYHAALIGKYVIEELLSVPVRVEIASEFNYYGQTLARTAAIAITQSGETADTLKTIRKLKAARCLVIAITNVVGSSASRLADHTIYT